MDYEKAYKEALERAKNLHKDAIGMDENIRAKQCEIIFPELKESEDEKIRNQIINFIEEYGNPIHCEWQKDWIAWLEKQGEKKCIDDLTQQEAMDIAVAKCFEHGEQKPTEWNISDFRTWQHIVSDVLTKHQGIGQYLDGGEYRKIAKYMQEEWSKRLCLNQKPTWSEEDEIRLDRICKTLWKK